MPSGSSTDKQPPKLFWVAVPFCAAIAGLGLWFPQAFARAGQTATGTILAALDWFFMALVTGMLVFLSWLAFSRFGRIKLGVPDDEPEFSTRSWLAMLFAAGMGVGLVFWGVAEPVTHFGGVPGVEPRTAAAARQALVVTTFHWGLHAWAIYGVAALVLAYFGFRRGTGPLPGAPIRAAFRGPWVQPAATIANLVAVLAIVFGVAGALAMGVFQIHTGLFVIAGAPPDSRMVPLLILAFVVLAYTASAMTSLDKGIRWLSNINAALAIALLAFVLAAGPTGQLLRGFVTGAGDYIAGLVSLSLRLYPYDAPDWGAWLHEWTLNYMLWWIAWAPFVGVFIARISKGRTIREFVLGVLLVPTVFSLLWFSVFGGTALAEELHGDGGIAGLVREDVSLALFALFDRLPMSTLLGVVSVALVLVFVITSADSATFVLGMLTTGGSLDPPTRRKLAWGVILGALSAALVISENIFVVRAIAIIGAIPFTFIMLVQIGALVRALRSEREAP